MITDILLWAALLVGILVVAQKLVNKYGTDNESSRKLVHILHGIGLAGLAFLGPLEILIVIEALFILTILAARYAYQHAARIPPVQYVKKLYNVGRTSYGDFFFPISAIILVFLAASKWEFATIILVLGIADAAAALIGKRFGRRNSYVVFGQKKSFIGSLAFFIGTLGIVGGFMLLHGNELTGANFGTLIGISLVLTGTENLGVYGSDNLLIPLVGVILLNAL